LDARCVIYLAACSKKLLWCVLSQALDRSSIVLGYTLVYEKSVFKVMLC
jgi:hypothetical protein